MRRQDRPYFVRSHGPTFSQPQKKEVELEVCKQCGKERRKKHPVGFGTIEKKGCECDKKQRGWG